VVARFGQFANRPYNVVARFGQFANRPYNVVARFGRFANRACAMCQMYPAPKTNSAPLRGIPLGRPGRYIQPDLGGDRQELVHAMRAGVARQNRLAPVGRKRRGQLRIG
jgi:hypothetical protein